MLWAILILILLCVIEEEDFWALLTIGASLLVWGLIIITLIAIFGG